MSINKSKIIWFLICPILLVLFLIYFICVAYFYDPLQLFSEKYAEYFPRDDRVVIKRILDKNNYNGVIVGSSMLIASNPNELHGKWVNVSYSGANLKSRLYIIEYILKNNMNVTDIVISYDGFWQNRLDRNDIIFIFENKIIKRFNYYINNFFNNPDNKKCLFFLYNKHCLGFNNYSYQNYSWIKTISEEEQHRLFDIVVDYDNIQEKLDREIIDGYSNYFSLDNKTINRLYNIMKQYKNINFHIIIPPYPIIALKYNYCSISCIKNYFGSGIKELMLDNTKIYWFYSEEFVNNPLNYLLDIWHYQPHINSRINKAINEGTNIITKDNMDEYFDRFIKKVESYDIKAYEEALRLDIRE